MVSGGGAASAMSSARCQAALMGFVFLLTFAAYDTIQVFAKRLYPGDLGPNMTLAIYGAFTLGEFIAPTVVNKFGPRASMCVGILGYASLVVAGLIYFESGYAPWIVVLSGVLLGLGASLLWTGQGRLILEYGSDGDRGTLFGIFWALYRGASVLGGLLSYTYFSVEGSGSGDDSSPASSDSGSGDSTGSTGLYIIFLALVLSGAMATLFLKRPQDVRGDARSAADGAPGAKRVSTNLVTGTLEQPDGSDDDTDDERGGLLGAAALVDPSVDHSIAGAGSWWHEAADTFRMFGSRRMLLLAPLFWTSGGNEPYILSGFTDRWFEKRTTGMEMVIYFSLSIVGSVFCGRFLDWHCAHGLHRRGAVLLIALFSAVHGAAFACAAVVETQSRWEHRYKLSEGLVALPTVAFGLWGLSDAIINTFLYWIIGALYADGGEKARAVGFYKLLNSAAHVVGYGILPTHRVSASAQLWYNIGLFAVGVPGAVHVCSSDLPKPRKPSRGSSAG